MRTRKTAKPRKQFSPGQDKNAIKKKAPLVIGGRKIIWAKENPGEYLLAQRKLQQEQKQPIAGKRTTATEEKPKRTLGNRRQKGNAAKANDEQTLDPNVPHQEVTVALDEGTSKDQQTQKDMEYEGELEAQVIQSVHQHGMETESTEVEDQALLNEDRNEREEETTLAEEELPPLQVEQIHAADESTSDDGCLILMAQQSASSASHQQLHNPEWSDDSEGYLRCVRGNCIEGKYEVVKKLGEGVFANVVQVRDLLDGKDKALKIVRNTPAYREAAKQEIRTLKALQQADPNGRNQLVVRLLDHFEFNGHYCLLFNNYGENVFEFMKKNKYHPYPMDQVRFIAYQLIHAVKFLHDQSLTHTDLKPENILFVDTSKANTTMVTRWYVPDELWALPAKQRPKKNAKFKVLKDASIRLIDLGSAVFEGQRKDEIVSTRHYRAPEIILKLGWDQSCDVWSLGCIFFELYTGHPLFPRMDDHHHLAVIERSVGSIPNSMKRQSRIKSNDLFYDAHGQLNCDEGIQAFAERRGKPLEEYMQSQGIEHQHLFRLIADMLSIDPAKRLTLTEAKQHVFFKENENFDELRAETESTAGTSGDSG